jgi:uncharacterized protein (TIGR00251 family)
LTGPVRAGAVRVVVHVTPGARSSSVGGRYGGADAAVLAVRVTAPAREGRANAATLEALGRALGIPRRRLTIVSGEHSRTKVIEIEGVDQESIAALLRS